MVFITHFSLLRHPAWRIYPPFSERPSRLSCSIQAFPCTFYILGTPLIGFSIALIAFDRFYAVISPARYFKSEAKQAWFGVAGEQSQLRFEVNKISNMKGTICRKNITVIPANVFLFRKLLAKTLSLTMCISLQCIFADGCATFQLQLLIYVDFIRAIIIITA